MADLTQKFNELVAKDTDSQAEFFLKSFIFDLGDNWKDVPALATKFKDYLKQTGEGFNDLNAQQAADFLQKNGLTRTGIERREELKDIDLDKNDRIAFTEYLLIHYKKMILEAYYKRKEMEPEVDLSNNCIGVTGVGPQLLEELFTLPIGLDPALEKAIEEFTAQKRARETKMKELQEKSEAGGVKGLAAKNELAQLLSEDTTSMNRIELTLNAAKKKAGKNSSEKVLAEKKKQEEAEKKAKLDAGRAKLRNVAAMFDKKD